MKPSEVIAIVTGGASGLGEAVVRKIVADGGKVSILDRPQSKGPEVAAALGSSAIFTPADVTEPAAVKAAVDQTIQRFGKLTVAVNCAGVGTAGRVLDKHGAPHPLDLFEMTIRINLVGTFNVLRLAAAAMARNEPNEYGERGVIVNTASIAAFDGQVGQAAYSASKGGVVGMTLPIARDLAPRGIRVMTVAPGTFNTPMMAMVSEDFKRQLAAQIPFPSRLGEPPEFAALVAHILANPYLNGEIIRIDGALRMPPR